MSVISTTTLEGTFWPDKNTTTVCQGKKGKEGNGKTKGETLGWGKKGDKRLDRRRSQEVRLLRCDKRTFVFAAAAKKTFLAQKSIFSPVAPPPSAGPTWPSCFWATAWPCCWPPSAATPSSPRPSLSMTLRARSACLASACHSTTSGLKRPTRTRTPRSELKPISWMFSRFAQQSH